MIVHIHGQSTQRKGSIVIFVAFSMVALIGFLALSLDGGALLSERRHAQAVADSAALAGASHLYYEFWVSSGLDQNGASAAAKAAAARNGYNNDGVVSNVEVHNPPISGFYAGRSGYVEVVVTYKYPRGFSSLFGSGTIEVKARSVAFGAPIAADVGILVLDPSAKDALSVGGGGVVNVSDTPVVVNSTNPEGTIVSGGTTLTAPDLYLTGNYTTTGGGVVNSDVHVGRSPLIDPFLFLPVPDPSTMIVRETKKLQETQNSLVLFPGVYVGGINVSGTGSLFLTPGIYYMKDGGFSFTGQGSLIGLGVLIYSSPGQGNADGINIAGQGAITLTGMTSGIYQGMTFWQERSSTVTGNISGSSLTTSITGTFYFPGAHLNVSGNGGVVNVGSQYVSKTLSISGNGTIDLQWSPYTVGRRRLITLVE
jgi:Putative Flp pilus-assembly TadE/G-like